MKTFNFERKMEVMRVRQRQNEKLSVRNLAKGFNVKKPLTYFSETEVEIDLHLASDMENCIEKRITARATVQKETQNYKMNTCFFYC